MWPPYFFTSSLFPKVRSTKSLLGHTAFLNPAPWGQGQCWVILLSLLPWTGSGKCWVNVHGIPCLFKGEDWDVMPQECSLTFAWVLLQAGAAIVFDIMVRCSLNSNLCLLSPLFSSSRISRFTNVYHLSIHISKNFGADTTKVFYIGLRGEWTEVRWGWRR